ncbi:MAG: DUF3095 domain-containing protein [Pseudomonadota bacterium]
MSSNEWDSNTSTWYGALPVRQGFSGLTDTSAYQPIPSDWFLAVSDIVGSTDLLNSGHYKTVNTIGASVLAALMNAVGHRVFPSQFGGDGAVAAFGPGDRAAVTQALAAISRWAWDEFEIDLRVAIVPVNDVRKAGLDVSVARHSASANVDYTMFAGGGVSWAEREMKTGNSAIARAARGVVPDLTGLSCRWTPIPSVAGSIVSLVVSANEDADPTVLGHVLKEVLTILDQLVDGGHPIPSEGPGYQWPPEGLTLEAKASLGTKSLAKRKMELLFETFVAWVFFKTGMKAGGFDARQYVKTTGRNADFRKFEDGLKITVDCSPTVKDQIIACLDQAEKSGHLTYGLFEQEAALLTCIVPSVMEDDHFHYVDGAGGGYAMAASQLKAKLAAT